jgi:hypothetical protein
MSDPSFRVDFEYLRKALDGRFADPEGRSIVASCPLDGGHSRCRVLTITHQDDGIIFDCGEGGLCDSARMLRCVVERYCATGRRSHRDVLPAPPVDDERWRSMSHRLDRCDPVKGRRA